MMKHIIVQESNDVKPVAYQAFGSAIIVRLPIAVRVAIEFNDEVDCVAIKVGDERLNDMLAAEFNSAELAVAEAVPQNLLGRCGLVTHGAGSL